MAASKAFAYDLGGKADVGCAFGAAEMGCMSAQVVISRRAIG